MGQKPVIFLLASPSAGIDRALERLADVGYDLVTLDEVAKDHSGVALLPIGRNFDMTRFEDGLRSLRKVNPDMEWIAVYTGRLKIKLPVLNSLGFSDVYQIPLDEELFTNRIFELVPLEISGKDLKFEHLLRVNLPLLKETDQAPFDVFLYLPSNKRIMLYFREGQAIERAQLERLEKHKNSSLFIRKPDIRKYKEFSSKALLKIKDDSGLSDEQKVVQVQENVQVLMSPFFSEAELGDAEGKQTIMQMQDMLRGLQIRPGVQAETLASLEKLAAQKMTNASHATNVGVYCALFGIALGLKNIDDLRLGGLLHDVGMADLPIELLEQDEKNMTPEDRSRYHLHPGNGRTDVLNRKVPVPEVVLNMILLHHERCDGSGYPYGKTKDEIPVEAQICAFADEFDKLTSLRQGYRCYTPKEALLLMAGRLGQPAMSVFNPEIHGKIVDFYLNPRKGMAEAVGSLRVENEGAGEIGRVKVEKQIAKKDVERKKLDHPILLNDFSKRFPVRPTTPMSYDPEVELEVQALERELEFHFLESSKAE